MLAYDSYERRDLDQAIARTGHSPAAGLGKSSQRLLRRAPGRPAGELRAGRAGLPNRARQRPGLARGYRGLAGALGHLHRSDEAWSAFRNAQTLLPNDLQTHCCKAWLYARAVSGNLRNKACMKPPPAAPTPSPTTKPAPTCSSAWAETRPSSRKPNCSCIWNLRPPVRTAASDWPTATTSAGETPSPNSTRPEALNPGLPDLQKNLAWAEAGAE